MRKVSLLLVFILLCTLAFSQEDGKDGPTGIHAKTVTIDGLEYILGHKSHTATIANGNHWEGELDIPEKVTYDGEEYTVNSLLWLAFHGCKTLTRVRIPKTVSSIEHYAYFDDCKNPFSGCSSLEAIEVDEENQWMCSVDGVLFSKDRIKLYCYPAGASREVYYVPESVEWIGINALAHNTHLTSVYVPNSVTFMSSAFQGCKRLKSIRLSENVKYIHALTFAMCDSLHFLDIPESVNEFGENVFTLTPIKTLVIRGTFPKGLRNDTFRFMDEAVIYAQRSEIEKFKKVFSGTVLPLEAYQPTGVDIPAIGHSEASCTFDLQGRRVTGSPRPGIYIYEGRKRIKK